MSALPFIDPTAGGGKATIAPAPRPMDLAGKVIGLLDNTKEQGDVILATERATEAPWPSQRRGAAGFA